MTGVDVRAAAATGSGHAGDLAWEAVEDGFVSSVRRHDTYRIVVRRGSLHELGDLVDGVAKTLSTNAAIVVTDRVVAGLHLRTALDALESPGLPVDAITLPPGEGSKSIRGLRELWGELRRRGAERRTVLVALGGGVICDLVGFAAATYMRGMPYVNVPTSLLAQADAAIGGKVAVDDADAKNLYGAFHHPALVVVDPAALATLPAGELANGLAEVVKVAVIRSEPLFAALEREEHADADGVEQIVRRAIELKLSLLESDPFEADLRRALNLGHCLGHPVEAASEFAYRHGEAVAIGMALATEIGRGRGICAEADAARIIALLHRLGLPTRLPPALAGAVWERARVVRQIRNGSMNVVVPAAVGRCEILPEVEEAEFHRAVARRDAG